MITSMNSITLQGCSGKLLRCGMIAGLSIALVWEACTTLHEWLLSFRGMQNGNLVLRLAPLDAFPHSIAGRFDLDQDAAELQKAVALDPWDSTDMLLLSAHYESAGDRTSAERLLTEAADRDLGSAPRLALSNFYLRSGNDEKFFDWANKYRAIALGSHEALLRLAFDVDPVPASLQARFAPMSCEEVAEMLKIVDERNSAVATPEEQLMQCTDRSSRLAGWQHVSRLLAKGRGEAARNEWIRLGNPANLFNGDFASPISGEGFDWRVNQDPNIALSQRDFNSGLEIHLSGATIEGAVAAYQPVALVADRPYRLTLTFKDTSHDNDCLQAEIVELSTGKILASGHDNWKMIGELKGEWSFVAPKTTAVEGLALIYLPPADLPREDRTFDLANARLEATQDLRP
jgi:hypothetical protein